MGMWKGQFLWLQKIRMIINNNPKSLKIILLYIDALIILHNMLIELGDDSDEGVDWNVDDEVLTDIDDAGRIPKEDVLHLPIPRGAPKGTRREQLKNLMREKYVPSFNFRRRDRESSMDKGEGSLPSFDKVLGGGYSD